jgi:hypothetical protein
VSGERTHVGVELLPHGFQLLGATVMVELSLTKHWMALMLFCEASLR